VNFNLPLVEGGNMVAGQHKRRAVGVFSTRQEAEEALIDLKNSGFSMDTVSVIARDADRQDELAGASMSDRVMNEADEGAATGAVTGTALGGFAGLLVGLGALAIPGAGPLIAAGTIGTTLATTAAGAGIGAASGGLVGALAGLGIADERAKVYGDRVSQGGYLIIVDGTTEEIRLAESILHNRGIQEWGVYDSPTH
jgi:uncharacterized membrane protein